jgi:hypothetical protein
MKWLPTFILVPADLFVINILGRSNWDWQKWRAQVKSSSKEAPMPLVTASVIQPQAPNHLSHRQGSLQLHCHNVVSVESIIRLACDILLHLRLADESAHGITSVL